MGALATARAGVRHVLRRVLNRLEMKDYGYTTEPMLMVTDSISEKPQKAIVAPPPAPVQSPSFAARAQAAQKRGDWHNAALFWQKELSQRALPYVGLSEAAAAQGDIARAESVLRDGLDEMPRNYFLLEAYCRLAITAKRWAEVTRRWEMIEDSGALFDQKLKLPVIEAFLQIGDIDRAATLVADLRSSMEGTSPFLRVDGLLAEAREDWTAAADIWLKRGTLTKGEAQTASYERGVRALIRAGNLDRAEAQSQVLVRKFPKTINYAKLHSEVAIAQDAWAVALERWQTVEVLDPSLAGAMPSAWIYQIGVSAARKRTEAIRIARLRATGMLALASTIQTIDEVGALMLARRARTFYPEKVKSMTAQLLAANTRHSAAIWWQQRLMAKSGNVKSQYPLLLESLLESSRLEECEAVLARYLQKNPKDTTWLRAVLEIHYRRGDFQTMRAVMQSALQTKLPVGSKTVRVTRWIYDLIRLHPTPQTFFPPEINDLILKCALRYDGKFLSESIGMLLNPSQGDAFAKDYSAKIADLASGDTEIDPVLLEEMLQFFMRRRDWTEVEALLALPLPREMTESKAKKAWNIVRNKIDIRLGQADIGAAEAVAVAFLEQLQENDLDGFAMSLTTGLLFRLPLSVAIPTQLRAAAMRLGFDQMAERLADWQARNAGFDADTILSRAKRERCFIVGNAPSIAELPLHALAGEDIFCVNRGMRALDMGLPHPKYLVVADPHVYKSHSGEIDHDGASVEQFFMASNCLWRKPPSVPAIPVGSSGLKLSLAPFRHAPLHLHRGETVVVLAAQLAHLMGYKEIYIIGVDLDYSGPVTHFYGGGQKETERLANFRPGGSGTEMVNLAFANLQKVVEPDGCRLFNAAPAGKLEVLERVNFHDVLGLPEPVFSELTQEAAQ
ncbi:MAG: DUF115 domain-containing protein [Natronohydrobacter sp.]|nr:DUF115 domain-containing protein [Natronohydrobacter sp.]